MFYFRLLIFVIVLNIIINIALAGISPVHDLKQKIIGKHSSELFVFNSPHKVLQHLDNSILKTTKNVTQNPKMDENLYQISKDLVSAILSKLEIQDKITRITREALEAPGKNKGITAIETRRILDYLSRTLSGHILSITKESTEPELHRLVYGLGQIAAEISIISALKDTTYALSLSKKHSIDLSMRRKREIKNSATQVSTTNIPITNMPTVYDIILNKTSDNKTKAHSIPEVNRFFSQYSVIPTDNKISVHIINNKHTIHDEHKGFLNKTVLDMTNSEKSSNSSDGIVLENSVNSTNYITANAHTLDNQEMNAPELLDDWANSKDNIYKSSLSPDVVAEMDIDQVEVEDDIESEKKSRQKLERLEVKAKKAILYAGDVAYLTAGSVIALRRALTASIEVHMSVRYAKTGMSNHQDLMMNLAKTAAQQAGKEARSATSKSLACERISKLALKYTAQSYGAKLNHVANRIVMDTLSLATLAKSMAFVSSDVAMNSLYQATDVKTPS